MGGTIDPPPQRTTTIVGKIKLVGLNGLTLPLPYDSVAVTITHAHVGGGYTETALASGVWAFRGIVLDDYYASASRPRFGRSADVLLDTTNRGDSTVLTLGEQPRITPHLDSVAGSWDSGYKFFATMQPESGEKLGVLVRNTGEADPLFRVIIDGTITVRGDSTDYVIYADKKPSWFPSHPQFAVVAYNPAVGYYATSNGTIRYCSEGPHSNVMNP